MRNVLRPNCYFYLCLRLLYNNILTDYTLLFFEEKSPHPTAYIEKLLKELQEHVERLDRKRK